MFKKGISIMKAITKSALFLTVISGISSVMLGLTALAAEKSYDDYMDTNALRASRAVKQITETTANVLRFSNSYNYTSNLNEVNGTDCSITGNLGYKGNYKHCRVELENPNGDREIGISDSDAANDTTVYASCVAPADPVSTGTYVFIIYKGTESSAAYLNRAIVTVNKK